MAVDFPALILRRADLAAAICKRAGLSREKARLLICMMLTEIADALTRGGNVKLLSFGFFVVRSKASACGTPKTGAAAPITTRRVTVLKAPNVLVARPSGTSGQP